MRNKPYLFIIATLFSIMVGCKDKDSAGPAQSIVGQYQVSYYIVGNDTLISPEKGNLSQYPNMSVEIQQKSEEIVTVFLKTGNNWASQSIDNIHVKRDDSRLLRLTMPENTINTDYGYADGKNISLQGAGWNPEKDQVYFTIIKGTKF